MSLPNPESYVVVGWLVVGLLVLVKGADVVLDFYKKHIRQNAGITAKELAEHKKDVERQLKENRDYTHDEVHGVKEELNALKLSGDAGREGLHSRLYAQAELLNYLRGQIEGLMLSARASADAATRAATAAERAVATYPPMLPNNQG